MDSDAIDERFRTARGIMSDAASLALSYSRAAVCILEAAGGRTNDFLAANGPRGGGRLVAAAPGVFDALSLLLP